MTNFSVQYHAYVVQGGMGSAGSGQGSRPSRKLVLGTGKPIPPAERGVLAACVCIKPANSTCIIRTKLMIWQQCLSSSKGCTFTFSRLKSEHSLSNKMDIPTLRFGTAELHHFLSFLQCHQCHNQELCIFST